MSRTEKSPSLKLTSQFMKRNRSERYRPDERNASPEALICLNCPLPECKKLVCERFNEEVKKIKEQSND